MSFNPLSWFTRSPTTTATPPPPPPPPSPSTPLPEPARLRRQLTLLLTGSTFLLLSIAATRRTLTRKRIAAIPAYYHPNTRPPIIPPNGAFDALEALNLATLNTASFAMLMVGGGMFALDVCTLEELRQRVKEKTEWTEEQRAAEEEFEEWIVGVLARKERKEEIRKRVLEEVEVEKRV